MLLIGVALLVLMTLQVVPATTGETATAVPDGVVRDPKTDVSVVATNEALHVEAAPDRPNTTNQISRLQFRLVAQEPDDEAWETLTIAERGKTNALNVRTKVLLDESAVASATLTNSFNGLPEILLRFTESGAARFAEITRQNRGQRLAIVYEGKLLSAPMIMEPITGGQANITGNMPTPEARALVDILNDPGK